MEIVVEIVLPVFGVVILGFLAARLGWFKGEAESGLASFVFNFAVPLMLFRSLATAQLPETVPWGFFGSFYIAAAAIAVTGFLLARYCFGRAWGGQVISGMGYAFGNNVLLGLPLIMTTFGDKAALPFFILLSIHGLCFFTLTTLFLEFGQKQAGASRTDLARQMVRSIFTNPILLGIFAGLALNLTDVSLPVPVDAICSLMQQAVTPCALFSLGASLTRYGIAGRLGQSAVMISAKTIIMPFMVYMLATRVFDIEPLWMMVAVMMAAQPTGVMTYIFAEKYKTGQAIATTSIFLSTGLSIITLSVILFLFDVR